MSSFRQLMMKKKGGGSPIPARYTVVDYIESNGNQYIDTGLSTTVGFRFVGTILILYSSNYDYHMLCGSHELSSPYKRNFIGFHPSLYITIGIGNGDKITSKTFSTNQYYDVDLSNVYTNYYAKVDNNTETLINGSSSISNSYSSRNLFLFANNNISSGASQYFKGKMKESQIYINNELVADYVPVYDTVTQKYGMYDKVSQTFKGNLGSGDFSGGND